jgi:predicted RNA binding protein YcfA (HicA-like mRNA interferase family)
MSRARRVTGRQALKALQRAGFVVVRTKGSHHFLRHADGRGTVFPIHSGETLGPGLMGEILKDVEMERAKFEALL